MGHPVLYNAALALAAGMAAQAVAVHLAVPSIVVLLAAGTLLGSDVLGLLDPTVFGSGLRDLVSLAVTVILFEGGLALDLGRLRSQQRSLVLLLTVGAAISMAAGTLAARLILGLPWPIAALYGAIVIVTGPTVVTPLLSRLTIGRSVRELLVSEGVLIDPIGAIVAIVVAEYVLGRSAVLTSGWLILVRLGVGTMTGAAAGLVLARVLRRRLVPDDLVSPAVLAGVLFVAAATSQVSTEAGLMAAVAFGVTLANAGLRELRRLREFKEALTVTLLSFIFVVLAADLRLSAVRALGLPALVVVAVLIWVARPLAVAIATFGSGLGRRERLFVAWICPRGIVAAAVAGLFRELLRGAAVPGGDALEALVFVTVGATVTLQGFSARPVAHLLGLDTPVLSGTIIVGADRLGRLMAALLGAVGRQAVLIDRSPQFCHLARRHGLTVYEGDALSPETLEDAGARYADRILVLTRNPDLNALVAQRVQDNFRVERVSAVVDPPEGEKVPRKLLFPGRFPGTDEVNRLLGLGRLRLVVYAVPDDPRARRPLADLPWGEGEFAILIERGAATIVPTGDDALAPGDRLWTLRHATTASPLATLLRPLDETDPRTPRPAPRPPVPRPGTRTG
jgi:NhaP-type Na+/H+ or K+/H+ antiporter